MTVRKAGGRRVAAPPADPLIEALAEIEHEQWATWARHTLAGTSAADKRRWRRQIATPYAELSEAEKEQDRIFARKALAAVAGHLAALTRGRKRSRQLRKET